MNSSTKQFRLNKVRIPARVNGFAQGFKQANAGKTESQNDMLASANQTFETLDQWLFPEYPMPRGGTP